MTRQKTLFKVVDEAVDELRELEDDDDRPDRLFTIRRRLQKAQDEYIKQGDRVKLTKKFVLHCTECGAVQQRFEEDYYLHLRQKHGLSDEEAASKSNEPRMNYEMDQQKLRELLAEYTETLLEDDIGNS